MTPEDVKVIAFDLIKYALEDWGLESEKDFAQYCDGVCALVERVVAELERAV